MRDLSRMLKLGIFVGTMSLSSCASVNYGPADYPAEEPGARCAADRLIRQGCGSAIGFFTGTVVGRFPDGSARPLNDVQFLERYDSGEAPRLVAIHVSRNGHFRHRAVVSYSVIKRCREGIIQDQEIFGHTLFIVRASGCEEQEVKYEHRSEPQEVELRCTTDSRDGAVQLPHAGAVGVLAGASLAKGMPPSRLMRRVRDKKMRFSIGLAIFLLVGCATAAKHEDIAEAEFYLQFWAKPGARDDSRVKHVEQHCCCSGNVAFASVKSMPDLKEDPALEPELVVEFTPQGEVICRWPMPVDRVVAAVAGDSIVIVLSPVPEPGVVALFITSDGKLSSRYIKYPKRGHLISCPPLKEFEGSAYLGCFEYVDLDSGQKRLIGYQGPCTEQPGT